MLFFFKGRSVIVETPLRARAYPSLALVGISDAKAVAMAGLEDADIAIAIPSDHPTIEVGSLI
ncbi:hypothetical protein [Rhizobium tumorigenes]|uniref:hypothetical protein n=1 Tax=Rhizobium tumorigenes TaxID=2041385 RepID=UPI00241FFC56|nr:hypothetical protein [Rhizobium tumorigenes]WFS01682.1 hypothetical protein PR016_03360 [Rhizobium tumorigenes]